MISNKNTKIYDSAKEKNTWLHYCIMLLFGGFSLFTLVKKIFPRTLQNICQSLQFKSLHKNIKIIEITNSIQCAEACNLIKDHCRDLNALGFDCEWVHNFGTRNPVALLQLATVHGLCCLFRLNILTSIPNELQKLLNNCDIVKVGICPINDARYLESDYKVQVRSTLDLRHLFKTEYGLARLTKSVLGITLDKTSCSWSNWEDTKLTEAQKHYAAMDAFVGVELFKKWLLDITKPTYYGFNVPYQELLKAKLREISPFLGLGYSNSAPKHKIISENPKPDNFVKYSHITRKTPLYHNCYMHAPDGELLCSCDKRKALWYLERGLAEILPGEPFSIKLNFEPRARANENNGGRYYQQLKQNCCVVCGSQKSYLKHNVVPREYRKHFPSVLKDHQSHDVVLTCLECHLKATQHAKNLKQKLASMCDAPLSASKYIQSKMKHTIKNYAKALLSSDKKIPFERKLFLENEIKKFYRQSCITFSLLQEAASMTTEVFNNCYESHGAKVVKYFRNRKDGLKELEHLWRKNFVDHMNPQYLPALWSVKHNHSGPQSWVYE